MIPTLNKLQKFQNRAARIITGANFDWRSADVLCSLGWNDLETRCCTIKSILLYKVLNEYTGPNLYSQNTKSVPLPLLYSVVIYCTLFCFSAARSDLSANIATIVFEMICFNKVSVFR